MTCPCSPIATLFSRSPEVHAPPADWVKHGGEDPVVRLNKLGQRIIALHLKDMSAGDDKKFAEVGTGILDFKAILDTGAKLGVKSTRWGSSLGTLSKACCNSPCDTHSSVKPAA